MDTLKQHIPNPVVVSMDELTSTDMVEYMNPTLIEIQHVNDPQIKSIATVLDELIRSARAEIQNELGRRISQHLHFQIERLNISGRLKSRYSSLLFLRKFLFAMPPRVVLQKLYNPYIKHYFNIEGLTRSLGRKSFKIDRIRNIALNKDKTVVLSSFLKTVDQIEDELEKSGVVAI